MASPSYYCVSFFTTSILAWVLVPKDLLDHGGMLRQTTLVIWSKLLPVASYMLPRCSDSFLIAAYGCLTVVYSCLQLPIAAFAICTSVATHVLIANMSICSFYSLVCHNSLSTCLSYLLPIRFHTTSSLLFYPFLIVLATNNPCRSGTLINV